MTRTEKRNLKRLEELINEVLPKVPEDQFDIHVWYKQENDKIIADPIGWASLYKPFRELGLLIKPTASERAYYPEFKKLYGFAAVAEFFNLTKDEAYYLFNEDYYTKSRKVTKKEVVSRLKEFLAREIFN